MKAKFVHRALGCAVLFAFLALLTTAPAAAEQRVLVLPFTMNSPQDITFLQQGILDMLTTRLDQPGRVAVVSKLEAQSAFQKAGGKVDESTARSLAGRVQADYVLFGSVTMLGQQVSIDSKMLPVTGTGTPVNLSTQTESMDGVIPRINQFADDINAKVFGRKAGTTPVAAAAPAAGASPAASPAVGAGPASDMPGPAGGLRQHPDAMLMGREGATMNPLNPNFITAVGSDSKEGKFWRSPAFPAQVVGMDVADIDGDGKNEIAYATNNNVYVARVAGKGFQRVAMFTAPPSYRFLTLDAFDVNGDKKPELVISAQRRYDAASWILTFQGNTLVPLVQDAPWYIRVVETGQGKELMGQKSGQGELFFGGVFRMIVDKGGLTPAEELPLPRDYNVFNFSLAELGGEGIEFLVGIDKKERLVVQSRGDESDVWVSEEDFGGTLLFLEEPWGQDPAKFTKGDRPKRTYLPARILIGDLNQDRKKEILIAKNTRSGSELLERWRGFKRGSVMSLSYVDMSPRENWRTPNLPGPAVDYHIADYNNDGRMDLVLAVLLKEGDTLTNARSAIAAYELATPAEIRETERKRNTE